MEKLCFGLSSARREQEWGGDCSAEAGRSSPQLPPLVMRLNLPEPLLSRNWGTCLNPLGPVSTPCPSGKKKGGKGSGGASGQDGIQFLERHFRAFIRAL